MGSGASLERGATTDGGASSEHMRLIKTLTTNLCSYNTLCHDRQESLISLSNLAQTHPSLTAAIAMDLGAVGVRALLKDQTHKTYSVRCAAARLVISLSADRFAQKLFFKEDGALVGSDWVFNIPKEFRRAFRQRRSQNVVRKPQSKLGPASSNSKLETKKLLAKYLNVLVGNSGLTLIPPSAKSKALKPCQQKAGTCFPAIHNGQIDEFPDPKSHLLGFTLSPSAVEELERIAGQGGEGLSAQEKEAARASELAARLEYEFNALACSEVGDSEADRPTKVSLRKLLENDRFQAEWKHGPDSLQHVQELADDYGNVEWQKLKQCNQWLKWQEASKAHMHMQTQQDEPLEQALPREVLLLQKDVALTQVSPLDESNEPKQSNQEGGEGGGSGEGGGEGGDDGGDMSAGNMLLHLRKLRALFDFADVDGSGSISRKELLQAVRSHRTLGEALGIEGPMTADKAKDFERLFERIDADGSGEIEWEEFSAVLSEAFLDGLIAPSKKSKQKRQVQSPGKKKTMVDALKEDGGNGLEDSYAGESFASMEGGMLDSSVGKAGGGDAAYVHMLSIHDGATTVFPSTSSGAGEVYCSVLFGGEYVSRTEEVRAAPMPAREDGSPAMAAVHFADEEVSLRCMALDKTRLLVQLKAKAAGGGGGDDAILAQAAVHGRDFASIASSRKGRKQVELRSEFGGAAFTLTAEREKEKEGNGGDACVVQVHKAVRLPAAAPGGEEKVYCKVRWGGVEKDSVLAEQKEYGVDVEWKGGVVRIADVSPKATLRLELWGTRSQPAMDHLLGVTMLLGSEILELAKKSSANPVEHAMHRVTGHLTLGLVEVQSPSGAGGAGGDDSDAKLLEGGLGGKALSEVRVFANLDDGTLRVQVRTGGMRGEDESEGEGRREEEERSRKGGRKGAAASRQRERHFRAVVQVAAPKQQEAASQQAPATNGHSHLLRLSSGVIEQLCARLELPPPPSLLGAEASKSKNSATSVRKVHTLKSSLVVRMEECLVDPIKGLVLLSEASRQQLQWAGLEAAGVEVNGTLKSSMSKLEGVRSTITRAGERVDALRVKLDGNIRLNMRVRRGEDWEEGAEEDGGDGGVGTVLGYVVEGGVEFEVRPPGAEEGANLPRLEESEEVRKLREEEEAMDPYESSKNILDIRARIEKQKKADEARFEKLFKTRSARVRWEDTGVERLYSVGDDVYHLCSAEPPHLPVAAPGRDLPREVVEQQMQQGHHSNHQASGRGAKGKRKGKLPEEAAVYIYNESPEPLLPGYALGVVLRCIPRTDLKYVQAKAAVEKCVQRGVRFARVGQWEVESAETYADLLRSNGVEAMLVSPLAENREAKEGQCASVLRGALLRVVKLCNRAMEQRGEGDDGSISMGGSKADRTDSSACVSNRRWQLWRTILLNALKKSKMCRSAERACKVVARAFEDVMADVRAFEANAKAGLSSKFSTIDMQNDEADAEQQMFERDSRLGTHAPPCTLGRKGGTRKVGSASANEALRLRHMLAAKHRRGNVRSQRWKQIKQWEARVAAEKKDMKRAHDAKQAREQTLYANAQNALKASAKKLQVDAQRKAEEHKWAVEELRFELLKEANRKGMTTAPPEDLDDDEIVPIPENFRQSQPQTLVTAMQYLTSI